jgi:hypothetical protein
MIGPTDLHPSPTPHFKTSLPDQNVSNLKLNGKFSYSMHTPQHKYFRFLFKPKQGSRMRNFTEKRKTMVALICAAA